MTRSGGTDTGTYSILMINDLRLENLMDRCSGLDTSVSDPLYGCQWNLKNTGQFGGTAGEDINVEGVWAGGNMGAGVTVVIVDGRLDLDHDDLDTDETRSHLYENVPDYSTNAHGTRVAGIVAAADNSVGGRGVAPDATVIGHAVVIGGQLIVTDRADAMTRNMDVAAVSNNSWGGGAGPGLVTAPEAWVTAVNTGVTEGYGGKGVFYVSSAGNFGAFAGTPTSTNSSIIIG